MARLHAKLVFLEGLFQLGDVLFGTRAGAEHPTFLEQDGGSLLIDSSLAMYSAVQSAEGLACSTPSRRAEGTMFEVRREDRRIVQGCG